MYRKDNMILEKNNWTLIFLGVKNTENPNFGLS